MAEDGTWAHLDEMTVYVINTQPIHDKTGGPEFSFALTGTLLPKITATPKPVDDEEGMPEF